jgi:hypothetical protein
MSSRLNRCDRATTSVRNRIRASEFASSHYARDHPGTLAISSPIEATRWR